VTVWDAWLSGRTHPSVHVWLLPAEPSASDNESDAKAAFLTEVIGARLIEPTLREADEAGVNCYLETFDSRNLRFYQRLGFSAVGSHGEPGHQLGLHDHDLEPEIALALESGLHDANGRGFH
jgi:hypothetical protein